MLDDLAKSYVPPLAISMVLLLVQVAVLALFYWRLPPEIPLFYSLPYGQNQLTSSASIFLLPSITAVVVVVHGAYYRIRINQAEMPILSIVSLWSTVLMAFLTTISVLYVFRLVY